MMNDECPVSEPLIHHSSFIILHLFRPANCRISRVNRSATGRVAPSRTYMHAVFYDARHGRIAA